MIQVKRMGQQYYRPVAQPAVGRVEPVHPSVKVVLKKRRMTTEQVQQWRQHVTESVRWAIDTRNRILGK